MRWSAAWILASCALALAGCAGTTGGTAEDEPARVSTFQPAENESIVVCGQRVPIGTRVVLWTEPPHYDAYSTALRFGPPADPASAPEGLRYAPGRVRRGRASEGVEPEEEVLVAPGSPDLEALRRAVDQFVVHYDVCGVSQTCFKVLHDRRGLSVHFLLDLDGTLYQTLDLRETTWHATRSNTRSIGIEIANMGAYPPDEAQPLERWYAIDAGGPYVRIPPELGDGGLLRPGFVARPARPERVEGVVQGQTLVQYDLTEAQYESLARLAAGLCQVFPAIRPDAPRDAHGAVRARALDDAEWQRYQGILGHLHVQRNKVDPGPAFDWERFLARVRQRLGERQPAGAAHTP